MKQSVSTPKPRRWKTFSLRTLMIFVFLISGCWVITHIFGVASVARLFPGKFDHASGIAIAPFVVRYEISGTTAWLTPPSTGQQHFDRKETWFWFFGYEHCMGSNAQYAPLANVEYPTETIEVPKDILDKAELSDTPSR